jgi:serine/threonine protein phosphatase 1
MGKLSAIDVNSKEIWQSEPVFKLYPEEEGRN